MKISVLLPYKENFSPSYAGAVSLFVKDTVKNSEFYSSTFVFGNMEYDKPCLLYTSPSPRDGLLSRMPSSA